MVVVCTHVLSASTKLVKVRLVNCSPQSVMRLLGIPNLQTHFGIKVLVMEAAWLEERGMASSMSGGSGSLALWQWAHQVGMDRFETGSRRQELSLRRRQVLRSLDQMAGMTVVHCLLHRVGHPPPDIVRSDKSLGSMDYGMVNLM